MGFIAPIFGAIASLAGSFLGGGSAPAPPPPPQFIPPPAPPSRDDANIRQEAEDERRRRAKASGLNKTIRTSGLGVQEEPLLEKPTLLGE